MAHKEKPPYAPQNAWLTLQVEHFTERNPSERQEYDVLINIYPRDPLYKAAVEFTRTIHGVFDKLDDTLGGFGFRIIALFIVYDKEEVFVTVDQIVTHLRELNYATLRAATKPDLLKLGTNRIRVEFEYGDGDGHGSGF
jgi:hypothetical protein